MPTTKATHGPAAAGRPYGWWLPKRPGASATLSSSRLRSKPDSRRNPGARSELRSREILREPMDQDTDLFVQAFWVKCREVIRPEIDVAVDDLRRAGHNANVSTQEFSAVADRLPALAGPLVMLAV